MHGILAGAEAPLCSGAASLWRRLCSGATLHTFCAHFERSIMTLKVFITGAESLRVELRGSTNGSTAGA